jgi:hypothetical protein
LETVSELATALAVAQGQVEGAKKDANNPHFRSKYADLASVWDAIRKPLSDNGLSVVQLLVESPQGFVTVRTILLHKSGQSLEGTFSMPVKDHSNPQAIGSALTYARRYGLMALVGVAPEDDDGSAATSRAPQTVAKAPTTERVYTPPKELPTEATALRALYAEVRGSNMPQPGKQALMTEIQNAVNKAGK